MPGLGASLGRGGATTYLQDLVNSDAILIMGSNMAEAHPVAFRFVMKARERGAEVIHVDPRFTRTSACASLFGAGAHRGLWWIGGLAAGGLVPALGIAAGVDLRVCAALALAGGVALQYALLRGPVEVPAAPVGPQRA